MTAPAYRARLTASAVRSLSALPPRVAEPLVAFIFGSLTEAPRRRGKPLRDELEGYWSSRRGDYRVIYRIDDEELVILVIRVAGRSSVYRPR